MRLPDTHIFSHIFLWIKEKRGALYHSEIFGHPDLGYPYLNIFFQLQDLLVCEFRYKNVSLNRLCSLIARFARSAHLSLPKGSER